MSRVFQTTRPSGARSFLGTLAASLALACGAAERTDSSEVLATIGNESITRSEVEEKIAVDLARMDHQYRLERHSLLQQSLERVVRDQLLQAEAEVQGVTPDQLVAQIQASVNVTEADARSWYETNHRSLGGRTYEELASRIQEFLVNTGRQKALTDFARNLERQKGVVYHLDPFRVELGSKDAPSNGPANAPVTLVEFSDFECPFCGGFLHTLKELEEAYDAKLRVVYRQYPLEAIHPRAFKAAEASLCAHEQGRFWEMHDLMFQEQDRLDVPALKEKAARLGLKEEAFAQCLDSGRMADRVREDMREGDRLGVEGTPAIFINGMPVGGGAAPYAVLAQIIDDELRRKGAE